MQFDLILTDHQMPEMTGTELCARLRESEGYAKTPIIMVTGRVLNLELSRLQETYSITATFRKPFSSVEMLRAVEGCFEAAAC